MQNKQWSESHKHKNEAFCVGAVSPLERLMGFFLLLPVKDVGLLKQSRPHMTSSLRETPMKHCQVPDKVPPPCPGRMATLQSPQLCNKSMHSLLQQQPVCSSASGPSSCGSFSPSINGLHSTPRHRLTPLHSSVGSSGKNSLFTLCSPRNNNANHISQAPVSVILSSASPKIKFKDVKHHSMPSHIRNNSTTKSKETVSYSGGKDVMKQRDRSHKVFVSFNLHMFSYCVYIIFLP